MSRTTEIALLLALGLLSTPFVGSASIITLVEVDFAGSGSVGTFSPPDSQFSVDPSVTFAVTGGDSNGAINAVGGGGGTASWVYDGTGAAATNTDLHTAAVFGAPTRLDLDLGEAAAGTSFTITSVEVDIRASNNADTEWSFMYRPFTPIGDPLATPVSVETISINTQSGADPIATYSIDVTGENLVAGDSSTAWLTTGSGELRFVFSEDTGNGNDNLQIDAIRVLGTVVPEPAAGWLACLGFSLLTSRGRSLLN